jgi:membrane protein
VVLGIISFFILVGLWMHDYGSQYLEKLLRILRKRSYSFISLLILIFILFWYEYRFHIPYIGSILLFIPDEKDIRNEILDILTPMILLFVSSFYIFQVLLAKVRVFGKRINLNKNISLLSKLITILISTVLFPMTKSFVGSGINEKIISIVGYSSEYFPYFENVALSIFLILQFVLIIFLINSSALFVYSCVFILEIFFIFYRKNFIRFFGLLNFSIFSVLAVNNICLAWIVFGQIKSIFSENGNSKEIRELLVVTSYNKIPNRCNLLLDSYGKEVDAKLAFIDKDSVSLYIVKEEKFINESCR